MQLLEGYTPLLHTKILDGCIFRGENSNETLMVQWGLGLDQWLSVLEMKKGR